MSTSEQRKIVSIINATRTQEGDFSIRRPFPTRALDNIDPFLLLDHAGPMKILPGKAGGVPDHPHRGFETVTYMLKGRAMHEDSQGGVGHLKDGDVQWMTAGAGVVHSEMLDKSYYREGGELHLVQLWVNLPAANKMMPPRYQDISAEEMPVATSSDKKVQVKVIAGEAMGVKASVNTVTPIFYLHYSLKPGATVTQTVTPGHTAIAYVLSGIGRFGTDGYEVRESQLVQFNRQGNEISFSTNEDSTLEVLLLGGQPLNEPIARFGPFVMNKREEIEQAFIDYRDGKMGNIAII